MHTEDELGRVLGQWRTVLGDRPRVGPAHAGRELWPVTASDSSRYLLKRLGPWRNLPVADQARVARHLAARGVGVAEFMITDTAQLFAGEPEDSFVLLPHLPHEHLTTDQVLAVEPVVGASVAQLHTALAGYPWDANSYREQIAEALRGDLAVPPDIAEVLGRSRTEDVGRLEALPVQLVHGDLTPDNVLVGPDRVSAAFIDLDHLPLAPRVWDVGKYLSRRLRRAHHASALPGVSAFVAGYHRTSALGEEEVEALPAAVAAMNLLEIDWTTRIRDGELGRRLLPSQEAELPLAVDALRWQLRHGRLLVDAIRAGVG